MNNNEIIDPITTHTQLDRKAITDDALKVAEHKIRKTLHQRIETLRNQNKEEYDKLIPAMLRYNESKQVAVEDAFTKLKNGMTQHFAAINRLGLGSEPNTGWTPILSLDYDQLYFDIGDWTPSTDNPHQTLDFCGLDFRAIITNAASTDYHRSMGLPYFMRIMEGEKQILWTSANLRCAATPELAVARRDMAEKSETYVRIREELVQTKEELNRLPETMKELDIQATASRLSAAGGAGLLDGILLSTEKILKGEKFSGLDAVYALPAQASSPNPQQQPTSGASQSTGTPSVDDAVDEV